MKSFLAKQLRSLRKANNLTQEDMSQILHVQRQTYCNYEAGIRTPSLDSLIMLAQYFHVTLDSILYPNDSDFVKQSEPYLYNKKESVRLSHYEHQILKNMQELSCTDQEKVMDFILFIKEHKDL